MICILGKRVEPGKKYLSIITAGISLLLVMAGCMPAGEVDPVIWKADVTISDPATFSDVGEDARGLRPGTFGAEYGRMVNLADGSWLCVYTLYDKENFGYTHDPRGGTRLQIARSVDVGRNWSVLTTISDPGRDLDNGRMIQLRNGHILLGARSVRWQESYRLPVYESIDDGLTWSHLSTIDSNEGIPGSLGTPDKGVYEPHFYILDNGDVGVMYSSEKHVTEHPSFSQIISEKISTDNGTSWGNEIWAVVEEGPARPGMPVWTKMRNGRYIVVYEVCGTEDCNVSYKLSDGGRKWPPGLGFLISNQHGGPYVLSLLDGRLLVTSNLGEVSYSDDYGSSWHLVEPPPFPVGSGGAIWSSLYQTKADELAVMSSVRRLQGGRRVQLRFGTLSGLTK